MRRSDRAAALLEEAEPWDLVVLDEAHHARRRAAGSQQEGGPNKLLQLMQGLKDRTQGLVLLTGTPMQVHPVEVWDLPLASSASPRLGETASARQNAVSLPALTPGPAVGRRSSHERLGQDRLQAVA